MVSEEKNVEWRTQREAHRQRMAPWVVAHQQRTARGEKHPVYDFLFQYYFFKASHLLRWSPGVNVLLNEASECDWPEFEACRGGMILPAESFPVHRRPTLDWAIGYQQGILDREPNLGCFGLHEWAMVYRSDAVRHSQVPLRLTNPQIEEVVEGQGLRCTHYDAFRFFTPAAGPRNRIALTRTNTVEHDQPGCIHANMDLYKFAYRIAPFGTSELLADCFEFARQAREIDMRASPYDLASFGFEPIRIETRSGREEYVQLQRSLSEAARPLRIRLIAEYQQLCHFVTTA